MAADRADDRAGRRLPFISWYRITGGVMCLFLTFSAMPSLRVSVTPLVTYGDIFYVLGIMLLAPTLLISRLQLPLAYLGGALLLITMGFISYLVVPDPTAFQNLSRLIYAIVLMPTSIALWRPSQRMTAALAASYILGTCASVIDGVMTGPAADGRTLGFSFHPNGLGGTCLLSLALIPFAARALPSFRKWAWLLAPLLLYGIWISGSRGALAALGVLALFVTLIEQSVPLGLGLVAAVAGILIAAGYSLSAHANNALSRILGSGTASNASGQRQVAYDTALQQINDHPLIGAGFSHIREAQSVLLQVPASLGIPALIGFCTVLVGLLAPVLWRPAPLKYLAYVTVAYIGFAVTTDAVSDTLVWAPLSLVMVAALPPLASATSPLRERLRVSAS